MKCRTSTSMSGKANVLKIAKELRHPWARGRRSAELQSDENSTESRCSSSGSAFQQPSPSSPTDICTPPWWLQQSNNDIIQTQTSWNARIASGSRCRGLEKCTVCTAQIGGGLEEQDNGNCKCHQKIVHLHVHNTVKLDTPVHSAQLQWARKTYHHGVETQGLAFVFTSVLHRKLHMGACLWYSTLHVMASTTIINPTKSLAWGQ